jgi:hypothetical protein
MYISESQINYDYDCDCSAFFNISFYKDKNLKFDYINNVLYETLENEPETFNSIISEIILLDKIKYIPFEIRFNMAKKIAELNTYKNKKIIIKSFLIYNPTFITKVDPETGVPIEISDKSVIYILKKLLPSLKEISNNNTYESIIFCIIEGYRRFFKNDDDKRIILGIFDKFIKQYMNYTNQKLEYLNLITAFMHILSLEKYNGYTEISSTTISKIKFAKKTVSYL